MVVDNRSVQSYIHQSATFLHTSLFIIGLNAFFPEFIDV
jgi:hypothetical protein